MEKPGNVTGVTVTEPAKNDSSLLPVVRKESEVITTYSLFGDCFQESAGA